MLPDPPMHPAPMDRTRVHEGGGPPGAPDSAAADDAARVIQRLEAMGRQLVGREAPAAPPELLAAVRRRRTALWALPMGLSALAAAAVWVIAASLGPGPTRPSGPVLPPGPVAAAPTRVPASTAPTLANLWQLNAGLSTSGGGGGRGDGEPVLPEVPRTGLGSGQIPTARDAHRADSVPLP